MTSLRSFSAAAFSALVLTAALSLAGCDIFGKGGNEYRPWVTDILRVEVEPNPVAAGDTAVFTCVVEDSSDLSLSFEWFVAGEVETTPANSLEWVAPLEDSTYHPKVEVTRPGDADVQDTQKRFSVTVTTGDSAAAPAGRARTR
jgi:hypothetical protein